METGGNWPATGRQTKTGRPRRGFWLGHRSSQQKDPETSTSEPVREKTNNLGFRPGLTQTGLYRHRTLLEAGNFVFK